MASNDLDVDQLAAYLHLTPQQITRLAERSQLPGRKIAGAWRFSEAEVHTWLEQRIGASGDALELAQVQKVVDRWSDSRSDTVCLSVLLDPSAIEIPLHARTSGSIIRRVVWLAEQTGMLWDAAKMVEAVQAREELHPTALDCGVALLHPRRPQTSILSEPLLALGVTSQAVPFGNQSGNLTDVFFLICSTDDKVHLQVLAKLSRLISGTKFLSELRSATTASEAHQLFVQFEEDLDSAEEPVPGKGSR
jgi:nitrogen PTS system EIIA component